MYVLGLDIGGANIKAASDTGEACCLPFPLWKNPSSLSDFLSATILSRFSRPFRVAITMTGELCDCFEDKPDGVRQILSEVKKAGIDPMVYALNGSFVSTETASSNPDLVAASNWHAMANYSRRFLNVGQLSDFGILIDIGSTSCDLIPFSHQEVQSKGATDLSRMLNRELVYTGASRTPVCAVADQVFFRGRSIQLAGELFATMQDVYLILGNLDEKPEFVETADGRSLTQANSERRLARMLCSDVNELKKGEIKALAGAIRDVQIDLLKQAFSAQLARSSCDEPLVVISGSGSFLASKLLHDFEIGRLLTLSEKLGFLISESAPAFAVATLLKESKA